MNRKPTPSILDDVLSATPAVAKLSIDQIQIDGGTQMRAGLHEPTVLEYLEAMSPIGWSEFPPIIVYHDGASYWLADGFHRLEAYRRAAAQVDQPADRIPADVRAGTRRDAILYAAGANAQHGLRRTNADKRRAVETLLRDDEWRQWSDRVIAHACNVSPPMVATIRRSLTVKVYSEEERTYTTKHGTTATMQTANIGTKPAIQPGSPEARQLAKEIKAATWADRRIAPTPTPVTVDGDRPLPDWAAVIVNPTPDVTDAAADDTLTAADWQVLKPTPQAQPTDDRSARLTQWQLLFEQCLAELPKWAELTGRHTAIGDAKRGLGKLILATCSELAALNGQPVEAWGEEVAA